MKITKQKLKEIIREELKVGDTVTLKNNKKAKVLKLGGKGKGFAHNFVKVKPSSGEEDIIPISDIKENVDKLTKQKLKEIIHEELKSITEGMSKREGAEVIKQLGGGRFIAMTGAKDFFLGPKGMVFKIGRNSKGVNYVRINLNSMDTYDVEYLSVRNYKEKVKYKANGIYADMLRDSFEAHTGLRTSL
jgi:hypothetical protein